MSEFNTGRAKAWNIYSGSDPSPSSSSSSSSSSSQTDFNREGPWKGSLGTSMNAISFGFVATAILISMFLIMAIFEHLFRPTASHDDSNRIESRHMHKLQIPEIEGRSYASDFSVVMPGQRYPTFIAQPAPLPCQREGISWPSHEHDFDQP